MVTGVQTRALPEFALEEVAEEFASSFSSGGSADGRRIYPRSLGGFDFGRAGVFRFDLSSAGFGPLSPDLFCDGSFAMVLNYRGEGKGAAGDLRNSSSFERLH